MSNKKSIRDFVNNKIGRLWHLPENERRAILALLRRGIGRTPGEVPELWNILFDGIPDGFMGKDGSISHECWAIYIALTCYALHQQGNSQNVNKFGYKIGSAVRDLAERKANGRDWRESPVLPRFNAIVSANSIYAIDQHLRSLISILKSVSGEPIMFDYGYLAADLYDFQCDTPGLEHISYDTRFQWGKDLYRNRKVEEKEEVN